MHFDKIYLLQTGVSLEISTASLRDLIKDVMAGQRILELMNIRCTMDIYRYLSVIIHQNAKDLINRHHAWADEIKDDLLAGQPVSYKKFENLFWRSLDEVDPDGDEWYRLTANEKFHTQLSNLLNLLRAVERKMDQHTAAIQRDFDLESTSWDNLSINSNFSVFQN